MTSVEHREVVAVRVLVIDDEAEVRAAVRTMLEEEGHEVTDAANGVEAMRILLGAPVDLVVCDLFMPDMDGLEVIRELRRNAPDVCVIAMSGGGADGTIDLLPMARALGATGVLYKPFDRIVAAAAIDRAMRSR